jgi:hypothetical protein
MGWEFESVAYQTDAKVAAKDSIHQEGPMPRERPFGFTAIGLFFVFGAVMATFAATTLLVPSTPLDRLWALNRNGHDQLFHTGRVGAMLFVVLGVLLCFAAIGWFRRRAWGWALGTAVITVNMFGDLGQIAFGERLKGILGVAIAGMLLIYLTRPSVRNYFQNSRSA